MNNKLIVVVLFAAALVAIVYSTTRSRRPDGGGQPQTAVPAGAAAGSAGTGTGTGTGTEISLLYGTEKDAWLKAVVEDFRKANPQIAVKLLPRGSLEGAQAILDGDARPTLWSPADSLVLNLLAADWETKHGRRLFAAEGDDAPQPLLLTPLVFVVWEDRARALLKSGDGHLTWKALRKAVTSPKGWPAVGGKPEWGFVKLGHTDPTKSNSGLQALVLMTLEYFGKTAGLQVGDLLEDDYQRFLRDIERGVTRFEASTGTFMTDMVRFGPSKYDVAVVYESLAIAQIENAQGRWGNLRVSYPRVTLWSDHPVALLDADWVTAPQREAARALLAHLRGRAAQQRALAFGFRPADPAVPIKGTDAQNPFVRLAPYGLRADVPPAAQAPDGAVLRNLMTLWSRTVPAR